MTETDKVDFTNVRWGSVEWTNLCTLHLRACENRSPAPILGDTAAAEAVDRIEYDWARMRRAMRPGSNQYMVTMRAKQLDDWSGDFLRHHPHAVVLHLGCGLDTPGVPAASTGNRAVVRRRSTEGDRVAAQALRRPRRLPDDRLVGDR